jgi:predicted nucleotidyltransferase
MEDHRKYIPEILRNLKQLDPYKIVLFGSYARGAFSEGSDLDLLVVLDSPTIAQSYDERMKNKLLVRRNIYELSKQVPIDLAVYTKGEYDLIAAHKTSFYHEINRTGKVLYEKAN